ncbi:MAG: shikimate kinase [Candidatus Altiarchaeota archaeon]
MKAKALSHGAATIICAFATGRGGAFGVDTETKATVKLRDDGEINASIKDYPDESTLLLERCVVRVMERFGFEYGADITTESTIPMAAGLKSSSTAANASTLALIGALAAEHGEVTEKDGVPAISIGGDQVDHVSIIKTGIQASFDAKVTVTGAFDDASASYFGGYTVTNNMEKTIEARGAVDDLSVLVFLPEGRIYSGDLDVKKVKKIAKEIDVAWNAAREGKIYEAMTINGLMHSLMFKQNPDIAIEALRAGAKAAGLSGTGPSVVAVTDDKADDIRDAWQAFEGRIVEAKTNNRQARIL